jgi:hypothetical protein
MLSRASLGDVLRVARKASRSVRLSCALDRQRDALYLSPGALLVTFDKRGVLTAASQRIGRELEALPIFPGVNREPDRSEGSDRTPNLKHSTISQGVRSESERSEGSAGRPARKELVGCAQFSTPLYLKKIPGLATRIMGLVRL